MNVNDYIHNIEAQGYSVSFDFNSNTYSISKKKEDGSYERFGLFLPKELKDLYNPRFDCNAKLKPIEIEEKLDIHDELIKALEKCGIHIWFNTRKRVRRYLVFRSHANSIPPTLCTTYHKFKIHRAYNNVYHATYEDNG